jgi:hypothetical protein
MAAYWTLETPRVGPWKGPLRGFNSNTTDDTDEVERLAACDALISLLRTRKSRLRDKFFNAAPPE